MEFVDDTLHPVVQMRFGELPRSLSPKLVGTPFIVTIPPDHMIEFTFVSGPVDECTISFMDHTFGEIEQQIFEADKDPKNAGALLIRWGYPGHGLDDQDWKALRILDYAPTLSSAGMRITIHCYAHGAQHVTRIRPKTYEGKVSSIAAQVAADLGYTDQTKIFIEETDDLRSDEDPKTIDFTGNKSPIDFIRTKLLPKAKSKINPKGTYEFRLGSEGTFEFCTQFFKRLASEVHGSAEPEKEIKRTQVQYNESKDDKGKGYRRFEVLFGTPNGVVEWRPTYQTKSMGVFAQSAIASVVDPRKKQFQQTIIDRNTQGMTSTKDPSSGGRTVAPPIVNKNQDAIEQRAQADAIVYQPVKQVALGGHCSGKAFHDHQGPDIARNKITAAWRRLHNSINGAVLELIGLPKNASLTYLERFINVSVILPDNVPLTSRIPEGTNRGNHWSSGTYQIKLITHSITQGYGITVELFRPVALDGPDEAKTGPPKETKIPADLRALL